MDIKTLRIYVDSSIIQGCCCPEKAPWSKSLLEDFRREVYKPVTSTLVQQELNHGSSEAQAALDQLLSLQPKIVELNDKAETLTDLYLERKIVPELARAHAQHVALATLEEVDILTSWAFKYIVHYSRLRQYITVNLELGLRPLQIRSPKVVATLELNRPD